MKKIIFLILSVLLIGAFTFTYLSCTSSDDEGDDTNAPAAERQATLNQQTVGDAITYVEDNLSFCSMNANSQQTTALRATLGLVEEIADQVTLSRSAQGDRTAQAESEPLILKGNCPGQEGSATLAMNQNETTGDFTGTVTLDNYCQQITSDSETSKTTINGALQLSGNTDPSTNKLTSLTVSTTGNLTLDTDGETLIIISMQQASVSINGTTYTASMNSMSISEQSGAETHSFEVNDLSAQVINGEGTMTLSGSADFVDSTEGAVSISANSLTVTDNGIVSTGNVTINGAEGTSLQISPQGTNTFIIQADTDGDGAVDYEPGTMDCSGLDTTGLGS